MAVTRIFRRREGAAVSKESRWRWGVAVGRAGSEGVAVGHAGTEGRRVRGLLERERERESVFRGNKFSFFGREGKGFLLFT